MLAMGGPGWVSLPTCQEGGPESSESLCIHLGSKPGCKLLEGRDGILPFLSFSFFGPTEISYLVVVVQ